MSECTHIAPLRVWRHCCGETLAGQSKNRGTPGGPEWNGPTEKLKMKGFIYSLHMFPFCNWASCKNSVNMGSFWHWLCLQIKSLLMKL